MKILHLTDHLPDYYKVWGGAEKAAFRHITALIEKKNIKIYVGATKPDKPIKEKFKSFRIRTLEDFFPRRLHIYVTGFKNQAFPFDPIAFVSVFIKVLKIKPDLIHIHKADKISFAPMIVGKLFKTPVILAIYDYLYFCPGVVLIDEEGRPCYKFHGPWCSSCSATKKFGPVAKIASFYRKRLFDLFLSGISGFLVLSESNVRLLSEYGIPKEKIFVVRQVFYAKKVKNVPIQEKSVYLNAWMSPHKGIHIIVKAMVEVVKKVPQARLDIETRVLNPSYEKKVRGLIKKLGLEDKISIFERTTVENYLQNIRKANLVVVAEQWENMAPTTLADAMSLGKPVVASDIGGLPEMARDGKSGFLAKAHDPKDFAQKIIKILKNPRLAAKLGKEASKKIKKLGSEANIRRQLLNLYSAAISPQR